MITSTNRVQLKANAVQRVEHKTRVVEMEPKFWTPALGRGRSKGVRSSPLKPMKVTLFTTFCTIQTTFTIEGDSVVHCFVIAVL